jgi:hypothetical protein
LANIKSAKKRARQAVKAQRARFERTLDAAHGDQESRERDCR